MTDLCILFDRDLVIGSTAIKLFLVHNKTLFCALFSTAEGGVLGEGQSKYWALLKGIACPQVQVQGTRTYLHD